LANIHPRSFQHFRVGINKNSATPATRKKTAIPALTPMAFGTTKMYYPAIKVAIPVLQSQK